MKYYLLFLFLVLSSYTYSQKNKSSKMGQTTLDELKMTVYNKDSTATAVVLYEHANVYLDADLNHKTRTDYYFRIKILDKNAFDFADISVNIYKEKRLLDLKAITYNLSESGTINKTILSENNIYTVKQSENWTTKKFTMPNIKVGTVIEYKYSIISPYSGIDDWYFQTSIPKIKSEFDAAVLGNYKYNVRVIGFLKLDKDNPSVKKNCVYIDGLGEGACLIYSFGMNDIPAFKEEDYMLSKKNYISRLVFDLKSYTSPRGIEEKYTTTWKQADKKLKYYFFNNQTSKKSFFKKNIPETILTINDDLERAKSIYTFIKNHFTWNDEYWNNGDEKIKKAFQNKTGSAGEINLSLFNSLKAAKIDANLIILSTRNNGIPTTLFPVIFDFNYVIVKTVINNKEYFLDATNKFLPFGEVPIRCLNGQARLIDYSGESNWITLKPNMKTTKNVISKLVLNDEGDFSGTLMIRRTGYDALQHREKVNLLTKDSFLESFEANNPDVEVEDYQIKFKDDLEKNTQEVFDINMFMNESLTNTLRINPFFFDRLKTNPFKLNERNYPVDFAYPRNNYYNLSLTIPTNYKVIKVPEAKSISLPNNGGSFIIKATQKENIIKLYVRTSIKRSIYGVEEYNALKEFFKQILLTESSDIVLELKS